MIKKLKYNKLFKISSIISLISINIYSEEIEIKKGELCISIDDYKYYECYSNKNIKINSEQDIDIEFVIKNIENFNIDNELKNKLIENKELYKVTKIEYDDDSNEWKDYEGLKIKQTGIYRINIISGFKLNENSKITIIDQNGINDFNIGEKVFFLTNGDIYVEYNKDEDILNFIRSRIDNVSTVVNEKNLNLKDIDFSDYWFVNVSEDFIGTKVINGNKYINTYSYKLLEKIKELGKIDITLQKKPYYTSIYYDGFKYEINKDSDEYIDLLKKINAEIKEKRSITEKEIYKLIKYNVNGSTLYDENNILNNDDSYLFNFIERGDTDEKEVVESFDNELWIEKIENEGDCKFLKPITAKVEFKIPKEYIYFNETVKNKFENANIDFVIDNINSDTNVIYFIKEKYFESLKNVENFEDFVKIERTEDSKKYENVDENTKFERDYNYKISIIKKIQNVIKEKEKDKVYISLKFEVTDNTKLKLKQNVTDKDNIEIEQGKIFNDLLEIIKTHLGGKNLVKGYNIYKNNRNEESLFTAGVLENNTTYIVVFDETAVDFVKENEKEKEHQDPPKQDPPKTQEITNTEQTNNDDNETTKKGGYSGKNGKYSNK